MKLSPLASANARVVYSASYAVAVHEDLEAKHSNGQAKYLEEPARLLGADLGRGVAERMLNGWTLERAVRWAAETLLAASQRLVPVATGALRDSGAIE